jgi:hypothetical protein
MAAAEDGSEHSMGPASPPRRHLAADERGQRHAHRGGGLHERPEAPTQPWRHRLTDVRLAGGPLAANADPGEQPRQEQPEKVGRQAAQQCADAVGQDGPGEDSLSAPSI